MTVHYRHGSQKRAQEALYSLRHTVPNTAIIERRNGTARCMNASQTRRTLAFSRHPDAKLALGWWTLTVYNWCRTHRMLKEPLRRPTFRKKYVHKTPAMAIGIAKHLLSVPISCTRQFIRCGPVNHETKSASPVASTLGRYEIIFRYYLRGVVT